MLRADGELAADFFLFETRFYPMMQDFQNALCIDVDDPRNAVIFDRPVAGGKSQRIRFGCRARAAARCARLSVDAAYPAAVGGRTRYPDPRGPRAVRPSIGSSSIKTLRRLATRIGPVLPAGDVIAARAQASGEASGV